MIDSFFSLLNNKELKLINNTDAFSWLNEAYSIALNELNLVNREYTGSDEYDVTTADAIKEYELPASFSDLLSIVDSSGQELGRIELTEVSEYDSSSSNVPVYYLRGDYLGFSPTPSSVAVYTIRYTQKSTALNSFYDIIEFPDNNFYCVKDYMLFRAAAKLNKQDGEIHRQIFMESLQRMKLTSIKRDGGVDSWDLAQSVNI